jgi:hypothetical protein
MTKEISKPEGARPEQAEGPVFATPEELKQKEQLLRGLREIEKDKTLEGLTKQKEIYTKLFELDERRKERIANESGEEVYDAEGGIFINIRFKEGKDKRSGSGLSYISRHAGRPLAILLGIQDPSGERIVPNKPYKARVERISGKGVIYVRIIE